MAMLTGRMYSGSKNEEDHKIPLLSDVFREFPKMPINIDIKVDNNRLIEEVDALVRQYDREHLTVWGNFSDNITSKCHMQVSFRFTNCLLKKGLNTLKN